MIRNAPREAAATAPISARTHSKYCRPDAQGAVAQRVKCRRDTVLAFVPRVPDDGWHGGVSWFAMAGPQAAGDEAPGADRAAQFVKPFVKSQKNDTIDAEAIAEAAMRPAMRFTQVRSTGQIDLQALHRIRDQLVTSRTRLIN
jgi:transposase